MTNAFLTKQGIKVTTHEISGSVEIAPSIGLAEAICDIVSTGGTLLSNGLKEVATVFQSQAVLISNAIQEIENFIDEVSPVHRDVKSSAYLGDLLVTAYSKFSRNRTFGYMIGKGYSVKTAQLEMEMVAEGYYATKSAYKLNQGYGAKTPIIDAVYAVLYDGKDAKSVFRKLTESLD